MDHLLRPETIDLVRRGLKANLARSGRLVLSFAQRQPLGAVAAAILVLLILMAAFAPLLAPADPYQINGRAVFADVGTKGYLAGADQVGRDVLSRLIYGARISLYVSILSTLIGVTIGTLLGVVSATRGGLIDLSLQRIIDALMAFPSIILAMVIVATMSASLEAVIAAIAITIISPVTRAVRAQSLSISGMDYVLAAKAVGVGYWRLILRHVVPNCLALVIVMASISLGAAIIIESSLSFLGLGAPPEEPSWGGMMGGQTFRFVKNAPTLVIFPAMAIGLVVFAFNMLGDALRDVLDPRLRGSRE